MPGCSPSGRCGEGASYDLILLDAYGGDYIPEHLMTAEFLEEVAGLLAPGGVVAANTFAHSQLYDHESVTYRQVFGPFYNLKRNDSDNRIVLAMNDSLPPKELLTSNANRWRGSMRPSRGAGGHVPESADDPHRLGPGQAGADGPVLASEPAAGKAAMRVVVGPPRKRPRPLSLHYNRASTRKPTTRFE